MPLGYRFYDEGVRRAVFGGLYALQLDQRLTQGLTGELETGIGLHFLHRAQHHHA